VKLAFSERRKMMAKLLKQQWPAERVLASIEQLGISAQARAQTVSLEQFVALTKLLG
jgi:16S rRNA A1518/A1519 N6-dimethyltransferase RsmA/KsgA/DIM1 with predicted DNA glycosylase/AP lyase activity